MSNPMYDEDYCYECSGCGNDYYINDAGELQCRYYECECSPYYGEDE